MIHKQEGRHAAKYARKLTAAAIDIEKATGQEQQFWSRTGIAQIAEANELLVSARAGRFTEAGDDFTRLGKTWSAFVASQ